MTHAVIIGGGVIGLSLAYELSSHGVTVTVLERGRFGGEASWAGAGILTPGDPRPEAAPVDRLRALSHRLLAEWSERLREETGVDNGYRRCGALEVARSQAGIEEVRESKARWQAQGVEVEELGPAELRELEPSLGSEVRLAVRLPAEAQLRNPRHTRALIAACARQGVSLRPGTQVVALEPRKGRVAAASTTAAPVGGDVFVVAAGAWSATLLDGLGVTLGVRPVRGQIALLDLSIPLLRHIVWEGSRYLVPRPDGRVLVGSTEEEAGFSSSPTGAGIRDLLDFGLGLAPVLEHARFAGAWAGLRPGNADGLPYLGPVPGCDNLWVATGHYRSGLELSTGTARVLAQAIRGRPTELPLAAFRLDR